MWDFKDKKILKKLKGHTAGIKGLDLNSEETLLVTGGLDRFLIKF